MNALKNMDINKQVQYLYERIILQNNVILELFLLLQKHVPQSDSDNMAVIESWDSISRELNKKFNVTFVHKDTGICPRCGEVEPLPHPSYNCPNCFNHLFKH